jgi:hypothetical protein
LLSITHPEERTWPTGTSYSDDIFPLSHRAVAVGRGAAKRLYQNSMVRNESEHWDISGPGQRIWFNRAAGQFYCDKHLLVSDNDGKLLADVDIITAYRFKDEDSPGGWKRESVESDLNAQGDAGQVEKHLIVPQVRPVDSDQEDGPTNTLWLALLNEISQAVKPLMEGLGQVVRLPSLQRTNGCGRIARARWHVDLSNRPKVFTEITIDTPPPETLQWAGVEHGNVDLDVDDDSLPSVRPADIGTGWFAKILDVPYDGSNTRPKLRLHVHLGPDQELKPLTWHDDETPHVAYFKFSSTEPLPLNTIVGATRNQSGELIVDWQDCSNG